METKKLQIFIFSGADGQHLIQSEMDWIVIGLKQPKTFAYLAFKKKKNVFINID